MIGMAINGVPSARLPGAAEANKSAAVDYCMPPGRARRLQAMTLNYPVAVHI
jgi:hypothetical protein